MRKLATVIAVASVVMAGLANAAKASSPNPLYLLDNLVQLASGPIASAHLGQVTNDEFANTAFMPDWNRDGIYGDAGDIASEQSGAPATAPFLYPCPLPDGSVTYQTTTGTCAPISTPGVSFVKGLAERFKIIDAQGLALTATIWLPAAALLPGASGFPGLVFANGAFVAQRSYYMYDMTTAAHGFVVLSYDSQGQGTSEGSFPAHSASAPASGPCQLTSMSCRELQEMVRWFVGEPIRPLAPKIGTHNPADNPMNPALGVMDPSNLAIAGQSMGSLSVSNYLFYSPTGKDADGNSLPPVKAAVLLSGFGPASSVVPFQAQTADLDIPGPKIPGLPSTYGSVPGATDGPVGLTNWYTQLDATHGGTGLIQMIIQAGGSHGDTSDIPFAPREAYSAAFSTGYFTAFLDCVVQQQTSACQQDKSASPHLSQAYASQYDPDGPAGPSPSNCMSIPSAASLEQPLDLTNPLNIISGLLGTPSYTCTP